MSCRGRCGRAGVDDVDRHALARELDRVRVAQLMRCKPAADPSLSSELAQLIPASRRLSPLPCYAVALVMPSRC
jgi:hypothetical protein